MSQSTSRPLKLEGKVAIVTGGASGIGESTVRLFADNGVKVVVIADIQDDRGRQVAESIGSQRCSYIRCDVTDENQVQSMVESTVKKYGKLDVMFSNAGVLSSQDQTILDLDLSASDKLFEVNVKGMAACVKHAARAMVEGGVRGSIVCTGSVAAAKGSRRRTDYCMSKHAVLGLVRSASVQLGGKGIRVNCVSPSGVATAATCRSLGMGMEDVEKAYRGMSRLEGVALKASHVADAVLFLASDDSAFVTGHDLVVDGSFVPVL